MPTPADRLNLDSPDEAINQAIGETISQLLREGRSQDEAVAIAHAQAERATGKRMGRKSRNPAADEVARRGLAV